MSDPISLQDIAAMREAIKLSASSLGDDKIPTGGPFGAVIYKDGKLIAGGYNHVLANHDPSAHGEVQAIRAEAVEIMHLWRQKFGTDGQY